MLLVLSKVQAQADASGIITPSKAEAHLRWLSSDSLGGRGNGDYTLYIAAKYIAHQFKQAGLVPVPAQPSFLIPFSLLQKSRLPAPVKVKLNQQSFPDASLKWIGKDPFPEQQLDLKDFLIIKTNQLFSDSSLLNLPHTENILLWSTYSSGKRRNQFPKNFRLPLEGLSQNIMLIYSADSISDLQVVMNPSYIKEVAWNVAGELRTANAQSEYYMLGAHYDGLGSHLKNKSNIANGANDNASGTTALLLLAGYFGKQETIPHTLRFVAFSGEEWGLLGSKEMARSSKTKDIKGFINLEMLGVNQYGPRHLMITGKDKSALGKWLANTLPAHGFTLVEEPAEANLYERSDNFPFAEIGVDAHTLMGSDDSEPCYHQQCDKIDRMDFTNLADITAMLVPVILKWLDTKL